MKNKKIVVCLVVAVLVLSLTLTALVGCSKYKDVEFTEMWDFLVQAVENTAKGKNINNMELATSITVNTTYGKTKESYTIDFAAKLALDASDNNTNATSLVIKKGDGSNVLSAYYDEALTASDGSKIGDYVYLEVGTGKYRVPAVYIKSLLNKNNATVDGETASDINEVVVDGIDSMSEMLGMVAGFADTLVSKDGLSYRIELNLKDLLGNKELTDIIGAFNDTVSDLGLDLDLTKLNEILPLIVLGINVNVTSTDPKTAEIKGVSADLTCPKKNVVINRTSAAGGGSFLAINIAEKFTAEINMDFFFNKNMVKKPASYTGYTDLPGAINFSASGTITLEQDINVAVENIPVIGSLEASVPKGTYKLNIALSADPSALADLDFTGVVGTAAAIDKAVEALNAGLEYFNFEITKSDGSQFMQIELANVDGEVEITNLNVAVLGIDEATVRGLKTKLSTVMGLIKSALGTTGAQEVAQADSADNSVISAIAGIIAKLSISIADGNTSAKLQNFAINKDLSLAAELTLTSSDMTVKATISGLDKVLSGLPSSLGVTVNIKLADFKYGTAAKN